MKKILFVDDYSLIREAYKDLLMDIKTFEITDEAADGNEAIAKLKSAKFDLLITDISMPGMDGIELIKTVREQNNELKILVLTMFLDEQIVSKCLEYNIQGFLAKNSEREKVIECIDTILYGGTYWDNEIKSLIR
jgi:DNA-binding NarL/FixJ family response regulator